MDEHRSVLQREIKTSSFLETLFCGEIDLSPLHHFENTNFEIEIDAFRSWLLTRTRERFSGHTFLTLLKTIMAQIHADDNSDTGEFLLPRFNTLL